MAVISDVSGRTTSNSDRAIPSPFVDSDFNVYDWNAFAYNDFATAYDTSAHIDEGGRAKTHTELTGRATSHTDKTGAATSHTDKKQNSVVAWNDVTYTWNSTTGTWDGYRL